MNVARCRLSLAGLLLAWSLAASLQAAESFRSAYLSEFLAVNRQGIRDEDGARSGWIELANGSGSTINLEGWFLTDNPTNLTQWRFPRVGLLPDKYLLLFASGKDRTNPLAPLHLNFRLAPTGNYLALVNPATNIVSELTPAPQTADVSDGRVRGEPTVRGHFLRPTPGKANAIRGAGFAPEVTFSRPSGNFTEPFTLELSCPTPGAVIRYTLDGTLPHSASPTYTGPLAVTNTTHLRARAYQPDRLPGPPASAAYLQLADGARAFASSLPLLIMDSLGQPSDVSARGTFARFSLHEPVRGWASLTNAPTLVTRGGFRVRGSTSAGMPQAGYAVEFVDEFNEEQAHPLLGLPAESDWILYAPNGFEPIMIHNPFIHQLSRDLGRYSPRTRFVEVFVVRNSGPVKETHYHGIYVLEEKIKIGPDRVAIDKLSATDLQPPAVTGGYLLKFDRLGPGEGGLHGAGRDLVYVEPKEQVISLPQRAPQREYLRQFFRDFDAALNGPDWRDSERGYPAFLDVPAAIDFHVLEVLSGNVDAMVFSTYFHKPRGGKIVFGPHWDFDRALGSTDGRDDNPRKWNIGPYFNGAWWPQLFRDPDLWQLWADRWQELRQTVFSEKHINGLIDRLTDELREAQPRQAQRWDLQPRGGSYQSEINIMKEWLAERAAFIDGQFTAPPRLGRPGGFVGAGYLLPLEAAPGATVYYTLDGSDPRLPQGGLSPTALVSTGAVPIQANVRLTARARDEQRRQRGGPPTSTPWSRAVAAEYSVMPP